MLRTKEILKKLRAIREQKYLKQEHLARHLGIDRTTYIRKEKGYIPITTEEWVKLAKAVDKDLWWFFHPDNKNPERGGIKEKENLLIKLYRSLSLEEKRDLLACLRLVLKGVKRKKVRDTLAGLTQL